MEENQPTSENPNSTINTKKVLENSQLNQPAGEDPNLAFKDQIKALQIKHVELLASVNAHVNKHRLLKDQYEILRLKYDRAQCRIELLESKIEPLEEKIKEYASKSFFGKLFFKWK